MISEKLFAALTNEAQPLRIVSSHVRAINLQTPAGAIIALVTPEHGNGPFHIVVAPHLLALIKKQPTLSLHAHWLKAGPLTLPLSTLSRWDPHLPALRRDPTDTLPLLYQRYEKSRAPALGFINPDHGSQSAAHPLSCRFPASMDAPAQHYYQRTQRAVNLINQGLYEEKTQFIIEGTRLLAGLGPGLTPAGDDFLVGLLAAFYALGPQCDQTAWEKFHCYARQIATVAAGCTTTLSAAWLTHAGIGAFGETWHNLIHALNRNQRQTIEESADRILATGATSGADAMSGFLWGIAILLRIGR